MFYDPAISTGLYALREEEAIHAGRALRKRTGDALDIVDGRGGWYRGTIVEIGKRSCSIDVTHLRSEATRAGHHLTLLAAPTKQIDRFEWLLEKVTEIGVDVIQPVFTDHSERRRLRGARLGRILEGAMKQSQRAWLPELREGIPLREALPTVEAASQKFLAYLGNRRVPLLGEAASAGGNLVVAVGPEGGFSEAEAAATLAAGWTHVSLGPHRLRSETAAIAAVHTLESLHW